MREYHDRGLDETCLNCGKDCPLAIYGNVARMNENNGCWIPIKNSVVNRGTNDNES